MALATWKDLCIDAVDAGALARFWGAVLGLEVEHQDGGDAVLRGVEPGETIWVNTVPEVKQVKHRVHLDLEAPSVDPIVALGATMLLPASESGYPWSVMADPEGGEFCVFVRDEVATDAPARRLELSVDAVDPASCERLAAWWADVLGGRHDVDDQGCWWVGDVAGMPFEALVIAPVPEGKLVKNRIHWDVTSDHLGALLDRGATVLATPTDSTPWHVCADPEGNEFCVFASAGAG